MLTAMQKERVEAIKDFAREAFCIDGEAEIVHGNIHLNRHAYLKMTDSKRGIFYVAWFKEEETEIC